MARLPRLSVSGHLHLVVQRGHNGQAIAVDDDDRRAYLQALQEASRAHKVAVHGYALLETEALLLVTPADGPGLGRMMQALGRRYVSFYNRRHGRSGTLWEGRYRNTIVESERYFLKCLRHVELAPLPGGRGGDPGDEAWSSAAHHLGRRRDPLVSDHPGYWKLGNTPFERELAYRHWLEHGEAPAEAMEIRDAALKGWALGASDFKAGLSETVRRPLSPRPRGRPVK